LKSTLTLKQGHPRSLEMTPFGRSYTTSYYIP